ncbi:CBS domain-containing protein [Paraglaciecola aquimarina]|uniref:CBS domain-containing protein n=1 Tax=Paraglaciecola aquimarina TaxID=1235557 RepID=A0ABU3SV15_9ALTE|nr:CBS domain-containing protein [Paraglaciecola aquimarina]MDU0353839.1 CBS domain-containing protein [Paraglaciecola aquimarina]
MSSYKNLPISHLEGYEINRQSMNTPLELESPAIDIMANFSNNTALMLFDEMSIEQATDLLKNTHMSKALVRNSLEQFVGIVTLADLQSSRVLSTANKLGVPRGDLTIAHLMTPKSECIGLQLQSVMSSTIGDVLATMHEQGTPYLLVIAHTNKEIVGMISAIDIAKSLHMPVQISPKPRNFQEVMAAVAHR